MIKPEDRREKEVVNDYRKKLDWVFALEVIGINEDGIVGKFEMAQGQLFRGRVIPLCASWFE